MPLLKLSILLFISLQLTACATAPPVKKTQKTIAPPVRTYYSARPPALPQPESSVVSTARDMLGVPYRYGGSSPRGFDCSGLVTYAYQQAGIQVPRTSADQYRYSRKVDMGQLQPGDLLFFRLRPPKVSHVAIYDRDGRFIHAPSSGKHVSYASLDNPYWRQHLIGAGRFQN